MSKTTFLLSGTFLHFTGPNHKPTYLHLATPTTQLQIKLTKQARATCPTLKPHDPIQVFGETKTKHHTLTLKALQITPHIQLPPTPTKPQLLLCQKTGCQKKGSKQQQAALEIALRDRHLQDQVTLQATGCLGKCSLAPNILLMPDKKRLSGMSAEAIADLLAQTLTLAEP